MIPQSVTSVLISELFFIFTMPLALLVIMKFRTQCTILPNFTGIGIYLVFTVLIESIVSGFLLGGSEAGLRIQESPFLYLIFASVIGIICQEGGRLFGIALLMTDHKKREDSVTFGIGFAAMEGIVGLALSVIVSISYIALYNEYGMQGLLETLEDVNEAEAVAVIESLKNTTILDGLMVSIERLCYMVLSIELSVLMFFGYHMKSAKHYGLAALVHAAAVIPMVLAKFDVITSRPLIELLFILIVAGGGYPALNAYRRMKELNGKQPGASK